MPHIAITGLQQLGVFRSGFGQYSFQTPWRGPVRYGLAGPHSAMGWANLGAGCPEGARMVNGECECYPGRVWMPDKSKCVSPESPAYTGAITWDESMQGQTPDTYGQQELTDAARRYIEQAGYTIKCKIDDSWFAGPQGGQPSRICSINDSPYQFGAYAINLNPRGAITDYNTWSAAQKIQAATGIPSGSLYRTPETTALLLDTARTGTVNAAQAKLATESVLKQDARGIPEWGIGPNNQTVNFDAVATSGGGVTPSQVEPTYTGPAYNDPSSPYYRTYTAAPTGAAPTTQQEQDLGPGPYTGGYATAPGWTPPPTDYYGAPIAYSTAGGGAGAGAGGGFAALTESPWLLPALAIGALYVMSR